MVPGIVGLPQFENLGLKTGQPLGLQLGVPVLNPVVNFPLQGLRGELPQQVPYNINEQPIVLGFRNHQGGEEFNVVFLEHGITTLKENQFNGYFEELTKNGIQRSAIIIYPTNFLNSPVYNQLKEFPVKVEIPVGLKLGGLVNNLVPQVPLVLILEQEEVNHLEQQGLVKLGNLNVNL